MGPFLVLFLKMGPKTIFSKKNQAPQVISSHKIFHSCKKQKTIELFLRRTAKTDRLSHGQTDTADLVGFSYFARVQNNLRKKRSLSWYLLASDPTQVITNSVTIFILLFHRLFIFLFRAFWLMSGKSGNHCYLVPRGRTCHFMFTQSAKIFLYKYISYGGIFLQNFKTSFKAIPGQ